MYFILYVCFSRISPAKPSSDHLARTRLFWKNPMPLVQGPWRYLSIIQYPRLKRPVRNSTSDAEGRPKRTNFVSAAIFRTINSRTSAVHEFASAFRRLCSSAHLLKFASHHARSPCRNLSKKEILASERNCLRTASFSRSFVIRSMMWCAILVNSSVSDWFLGGT